MSGITVIRYDNSQKVEKPKNLKEGITDNKELYILDITLSHNGCGCKATFYYFRLSAVVCRY
jgi:hypothetical protein